MEETLKDLYERVDFILSGGALKSLVDFLTPRVESALIVVPEDADLTVLDAVGTRTEGLILRGRAADAASAFPDYPPGGRCDVIQAKLEGDWPWAVRIRGLHWTLYILLRAPLNEEQILELDPVAGLVYLWQSFMQIDATEKRLSRLSYMILATKNTLASIFEPMPLGYYAAFLADVLRESLFPRSLAIFQDDGEKLVFLEGDERTPPARKGFYTREILPPTPVVTCGEAVCEVILPIVEPYRLFCVTQWDATPKEEALNFLELVGNLALRSLSINSLRSESRADKKKVSLDNFTILSLAEAMNALKEQQSRDGYLSLVLDIFTELTQARESFLVLWDDKRRGYVPEAHIREGTRPSFDASLLPAEPIVFGTEQPFFDLEKEEFSRLFQAPWPEMARMRCVFPFWSHGRLEGFVALCTQNDWLSDKNRTSALQILAQFIAFDCKRFA